MFRLRTVRAKLLSLVAATMLLALITLPVLSWLLQKQLLTEVDDRAANVGRAYQIEIDDDVVDVHLASSLLSTKPNVIAAMSAHDAAALQSVSEAFAKLYPNVDIAFFGTDGERLARVGCDDAGPPLVDRAFVERARAATGETTTLSPLGCHAIAMPTYLVARRAGDAGVVVVGLSFNAASLAHAALKLGVELALVAPDGKLVSRTRGFPAGAEKLAASHAIVDFEGRAIDVRPFSPTQLQAARFHLVAALDVTQVRTAIHRHLIIAAAGVVIAAIVAIAFGVRLATSMSNAVKRIAGGFKKLERQKYARIDGVETGDEFEDLATAFNTTLEGLRERDKLKTTFGKYMTTTVMEHLLAGEIQLGGVSLTATVLFSDIRSFTTISEKMDATALVSLLNEYFTEMVDVVIREDGIVDKYIGDAIMAVFGVPVTKPDDALRAVRAALGMRAALEHLNVRLVARGLNPIHAGIGIHTGEVVAGNIGSERRMEYTVIGDTVNVAMGLETATKELGVSVLISEATFALVKDHVEATEAQAITVKGREQHVSTYALTGSK